VRGVVVLVATALAGLVSLAPFAVLVGLGAHRHAVPWVVSASAVALVYGPAAIAAVVGHRHRGAGLAGTLLAWSLVLVLVLPVWFPGERNAALRTGLGLLGVDTSGWVLPAEPELSRPEIAAADPRGRAGGVRAGSRAPRRPDRAAVRGRGAPDVGPRRVRGRGAHARARDDVRHRRHLHHPGHARPSPGSGGRRSTRTRRSSCTQPTACARPSSCCSTGSGSGTLRSTASPSRCATTAAGVTRPGCWGSTCRAGSTSRSTRTGARWCSPSGCGSTASSTSSRSWTSTPGSRGFRGGRVEVVVTLDNQAGRPLSEAIASVRCASGRVDGAPARRGRRRGVRAAPQAAGPRGLRAVRDRARLRVVVRRGPG
jgi:hypothetical protein